MVLREPLGIRESQGALDCSLHHSDVRQHGTLHAVVMLDLFASWVPRSCSDLVDLTDLTGPRLDNSKNVSPLNPWCLRSSVPERMVTSTDIPSVEED